MRKKRCYGWRRKQRGLRVVKPVADPLPASCHGHSFRLVGHQFAGRLSTMTLCPPSASPKKATVHNDVALGPRVKSGLDMQPELRRRAGHYEILGETYATFEFFQQGWNPYTRFLDVDKVDLILRRSQAGIPCYREVQVKFGKLFRVGPA